MHIEGAASRHIPPDMSHNSATPLSSRSATKYDSRSPHSPEASAVRDTTELSNNALRRGEIAIQNLEALRSPFNGAQLASLLYFHYERV